MTDDRSAGGGGGDPPVLTYTERARDAMLEAVRAEYDFGGWLAGALAEVAAQLGTSDALTAGRPGSWEAALVRQLVHGTVGWDDEFLTDYLPRSGSPGPAAGSPPANPPGPPSPAPRT